MRKRESYFNSICKMISKASTVFKLSYPCSVYGIIAPLTYSGITIIFQPH